MEEQKFKKQMTLSGIFVFLGLIGLITGFIFAYPLSWNYGMGDWLYKYIISFSFIQNSTEYGITGNFLVIFLPVILLEIGGAVIYPKIRPDGKKNIKGFINAVCTLTTVLAIAEWLFVGFFALLGNNDFSFL